MTDTQLLRMAEAAAVIRNVVGHEFRWEPPGRRQYGSGSVLVLLHDSCDHLAPYVNYDLGQYSKIDELAKALSEVGLFAEDCTGYYSAVYEATPISEEASDE